MQTKSFINHLLTKVELSNSRVVELVNTFTGNDMSETIRIMSYLTGFSDTPKIATRSNIRDSAELISYNVFTNSVTYKYIVTKKVKVYEKDADKFDTDKVYDNFAKAEAAIPDKYWDKDATGEVDVKYWHTSECHLNRWQS